jgi:NADPH-dependent ferric siderophore reductase
VSRFARPNPSIKCSSEAARWCAQAVVGDEDGVVGPRGSFVVWLCDGHLLVGDESAMPVIARRIENSHGGLQAIAVGETQKTGIRPTAATG